MAALPLTIAFNIDLRARPFNANKKSKGLIELPEQNRWTEFSDARMWLKRQLANEQIAAFVAIKMEPNSRSK